MASFSDNLQRLWGAITPWQTRAEREAGIDGTWGSGDYTTRNPETMTAWDTYQSGGYKPTVTLPEDLLEGFNFQDAMDTARDQASGLYGIELDENGYPIGPTATDYRDRAVEMNDSIVGIQQWLADNGIELNDIAGETSGMQALIDALAAGPTEDQQNDAYAHAARLMGLSPEEAQEMIGGLSESLAGGVNDAQGMSPEEMALRQRQNQSNIREMEDRARRMVENSLADTGSTVQMLASADEATRAINNIQLQQDAALAQEDFERQIAQFNSQKEMWAQMVQTNAMGYQQYMDQLESGMEAAISGYMAKIDAMIKENAQYLAMYNGDMNAINQQVQNLLNAADVTAGVNSQFLAAVTEIYSQSITPIMDRITALMEAGNITDPAVYDALATLLETAATVMTMAG